MILVTGATGKVGGELVRALRAAGERVRGLTRRAARAVASLGPGSDIEWCAGDLDHPETLAAALTGVRGVFLLDGYRDMPGILAAIRRADVERVVLLSSGSTVNGKMSNAIARFHMIAEAAVRESGVPWTILQPSGFMSNALRWLPQLRAGDAVRVPFADVPIAAIDPYDIAAVAALALRSAGHAGRSYLLTGPESLLPGEQLQTLARVLGRDLRLVPQSNEEARAELSRAWQPDFVDAFFRFFADGEFDDSIVRPTVAELTGRPPRSFAQWAASHAEEFK